MKLSRKSLTEVGPKVFVLFIDASCDARRRGGRETRNAGGRKRGVNRRIVEVVVEGPVAGQPVDEVDPLAHLVVPDGAGLTCVREQAVADIPGGNVRQYADGGCREGARWESHRSGRRSSRCPSIRCTAHRSGRCSRAAARASAPNSRPSPSGERRSHLRTPRGRRCPTADRWSAR